MKKIIYIISVLLLTLTISCNNDDYEAPYGDFSSLEWITTAGFEESDYTVGLNDYIGFSDVSRKAIEHSWGIPGGTSLLNNEFTANDSIYTAFIIGEGPLESDKKLVNVLFTEPGVKEVVLRNVFRDSVSESTFTDGNWIVNKTFTVTVFDDVKPAFKVMRGIEEILSINANDMPDAANAASWPTVSIEAGEQLTYVDLTTIGEPDARTWNFNGGTIEISGKDTVSVSYTSLGNFTAGSISSKRTDAAKPDGEATKLIPLKIEVIPSTQPYIINGKVSIDASEVISFKVTGEIGTLSGEEGNFVVNVVNTAAGFDENIPVHSVTINASDATQIDLTLSAPIYNTDEITLSFAGGNIVSVDSRVLADFGPEKVNVSLGNSVLIDSWAGFETFKDNFKAAFCDGYWVGNRNDDGGSKIETIFKRVEDKVSEGTGSMRYKYDLSKLIKLQGSDFSKPNGIPAATYRVSYMIYLETGNTMKGFRTDLQSPSISLLWDVESLPRGEWVEVSQVLTVTAISSGTKFDMIIDSDDNEGVTGEQTIYFDALKWIPLDPRP